MGGICPVHALVRQCARPVGVAETCGADIQSLPLFPRMDGSEVHRHAMIGTINALVTRSNRPVRDANGGWLYGGHSMRTGGAHLLASRGVRPFKIQALGRWKSGLVVHYAGEALASNMASDLASHSCSPIEQFVSAQSFREFADLMNNRLANLEILDARPAAPPA